MLKLLMPFLIMFLFTFSILGFNLWLTAVCCADVCNDVTCSGAQGLISSEFSTIRITLNCYSLNKYIYVVYLSSNFTMYLQLLEYSAYKVNSILTHFPFVEISTLRDFSVYNHLWLSPSFQHSRYFHNL